MYILHDMFVLNCTQAVCLPYLSVFVYLVFTGQISVSFKLPGHLSIYHAS